MNNSIIKFRTINLVVMAIALMAVIPSCKKSSNDDDNNIPPSQNIFSGIYYGTFSKGTFSEADTIVIPATTSSDIVMNSRTERGSVYSIKATTDASNFTIPSQSVTVATLGGTYTVTGTGTLSNSNLVIKYTFVTSAGSSSNWTFNGTKQ